MSSPKEKNAECHLARTAAICLLLSGTAGCATSPSDLADGLAEPAPAAKPFLAVQHSENTRKILPHPRPTVDVQNLPSLAAEPDGAPPPVIPRPRVGQLVSLPVEKSRRPERESPQTPDAAGRFEWPVEGPIIARFGPGTDGQRNDGINIATGLGTPIHAAAGGIVTYADRLKGYGNLVLIKHDNGYISAYAHAKSLLVSQGDRVDRGDVIGFAGKTGDVATPQLHFEIRKGIKPVNPKPLLVASGES